MYILVASSALAMAQSWDAIKSDSEYLYGEGWGATVAEADKLAMSDLISKIAVSISSKTQNVEQSSANNGKLDETSQFSVSVNTYSQATLTNTERMIIKNEPDAHVGRWIKRAEIERIFEDRKRKAIDMVESALRAEEKGKADDALRNYYWSLTLLKSLQRPNSVTYTDATGKEHILTNWIKERMDGVFSDLSATVVGHDGDDVDLGFTYKGKPVSSVDYTYFDGRSWSGIYSAKDGRGVLELADGNVATNYQIKYEYEYLNESVIDKELESVLKTVKPSPMRKAYAYVTDRTAGVQSSNNTTNSVAKANGSGGSEKLAVQTSFSKTNASMIAPPKMVDGDVNVYSSAIDKVTKAVAKKDYLSVKELFDDDGWEMYTKLIGYGRARMVDSPDIRFYRSGDYTYTRGVNMSFSFASGVRKSFVEDVIFTFDKDNKICSLSFGLGRTAEDDILNKGVWNEQARIAIMNFLENYKTAYALKRLDYIKSVFDDNAIIITGKVGKGDGNVIPENETGLSLAGKEIIHYNRQTKDQYIHKLRWCFARNEFVNIRFSNNDVVKLGQGGELYAIQIAQDYYSSSYGDKGYLFLMVDINDPEHPLIKVRTWQPEKDPDFGLYGPGDF